MSPEVQNLLLGLDMIERAMGLRCSKCGTPINVMGRAPDGTLHPGKACEESPK